MLSKGGAGDALSGNLAGGIGLTIAIICSGGVGKGHVNPAVTLAMAAFSKFEGKKVIYYWIAQFAGAFVASIVVYLVYRDGIIFRDPNFTVPDRDVIADFPTAAIFATYPQPYMNTFGMFLDQIVGTGLFLLGIFACCDKFNNPVKEDRTAFGIGAVLFAVEISFGFNCGGAVNPARDLAPRLFTFLIGYGPKVFTAFNGFFIVPIIGPLVGGVLGAAVY